MNTVGVKNMKRKCLVVMPQVNGWQLKNVTEKVMVVTCGHAH